MAQEEVHSSIKKQELEDVLKKRLQKSLLVNKFSCKLANEKGKNYGSLLLSLDVDVTFTENEQSQTLNILAKLAPPSEFLQSMFDFPICFLKEMNMYKLVKPAFSNLEETSGVPDKSKLDIIPPFYGARTSLSGDQEEDADSSAMLLLADLRTKGYRVGNQLRGLDFNHCKLVIFKLAEFHALPMALREREPAIYEQTVLKAAVYHENPALTLSNRKQFTNEFLCHLEKGNPNLRPFFTKIRETCIENDINFPPIYKEPFSTLVHNDLWTNNILFSYTDPHDPKFPTDVKFIDFQGTVICSPIKDIIFFLYSSAKDYVLDNHYNNLISLYYDSLINKLKQLHCDTTKFSKNKFYEEISSFASSQFSHIIFMLAVIFADKRETKDLQNITSFDNMLMPWSDEAKRKLQKTVLSFDKNGWLKV